MDAPQLRRQKEWMIDVLSKAGKLNSNNSTYQFWRQDNKPIGMYSVGVIEEKMLYLHNDSVEQGVYLSASDTYRITCTAALWIITVQKKEY